MASLGAAVTFRHGRSLAALLPIMAAVFIAFLVIGIACRCSRFMCTKDLG